MSHRRHHQDQATRPILVVECERRAIVVETKSLQLSLLTYVIAVSPDQGALAYEESGLSAYFSHVRYLLPAMISKDLIASSHKNIISRNFNCRNQVRCFSAHKHQIQLCTLFSIRNA